MADVPRSGECDALARKLHAARARLATLDLPPEARDRLQRQFIAVCDAAKVPGTASAACQRRLDTFLATLDSVIAENSRYKN